MPCLSSQVCTFLAPLLQAGLARAHAEAVCDLPGLGVFAEVPLMLSVEINEGLFALDPGTDHERRTAADCNLRLVSMACGALEENRARAPELTRTR